MVENMTDPTWQHIGGGDAPRISFRVSENEGFPVFTVHSTPAGEDNPDKASLFSGIVDANMPRQLRSLARMMDQVLTTTVEDLGDTASGDPETV